jgi:hypothetical protein
MISLTMTSLVFFVALLVAHAFVLLGKRLGKRFWLLFDYVYFSVGMLNRNLQEGKWAP